MNDSMNSAPTGGAPTSGGTNPANMGNPNAKLFVGSLAWGTTDDSLGGFFAQAGTVVSAKVIMDKFTGRSKGFGFVEMSTPEEAQESLKLDGQELDGRAIRISIARPPQDRPPRSDYSGGSRGGSSGGYGGGGRSSYGNSRGGSSGGGYQSRDYDRQG